MRGSNSSRGWSGSSTTSSSSSNSSSSSSSSASSPNPSPRFQGILMDFVMPVMDGPDATKGIYHP